MLSLRDDFEDYSVLKSRGFLKPRDFHEKMLGQVIARAGALRSLREELRVTTSSCIQCGYEAEHA